MTFTKSFVRSSSIMFELIVFHVGPYYNTHEIWCIDNVVKQLPIKRKEEYVLSHNSSFRTFSTLAKKYPAYVNFKHNMDNSLYDYVETTIKITMTICYAQVVNTAQYEESSFVCDNTKFHVSIRTLPEHIKFYRDIWGPEYFWNHFGKYETYACMAKRSTELVAKCRLEIMRRNPKCGVYNLPPEMYEKIKTALYNK